MTESWRCFVAVPIGESLRRDLTVAVERWRTRPDLAGLRWTDPAGWHVTLAFLGAVDPDHVGELEAAVRAVAVDSQPAVLRTAGVGGFPSARRARVAWYGIADPDGHLAEIAHRLRTALALDTSAPFRPHLTLARAKGAPIDLSLWREEAAEPVGTLDVPGLDLMRSHLGRGPARYEIITSTPLGAAAHV
jgi:RNA 2',3'-cyclic 3'-phosphodiesterase